MKHALILSLGLACVAIASSATAHDAVGAAVARHQPKSWFTPAQKAYINSKCGADAEQRGRNFNISGSVMTCPNGRVVDEPEVKAMGQDISRRANEFARSVMEKADVQRAIAVATSDATRKAIAAANIDAQIARALAQADIARTAAARARDAAARARIDDAR